MGEAEIRRVTAETEIALKLDLEGGPVRCDSGCGFLDHMLTLFAAHAGFGLELTCRGTARWTITTAPRISASAWGRQ